MNRNEATQLRDGRVVGFMCSHKRTGRETIAQNCPIKYEDHSTPSPITRASNTNTFISLIKDISLIFGHFLLHLSNNRKL